jgi:type I restriction-modification system DNA methylase subunit
LPVSDTARYHRQSLIRLRREIYDRVQDVNLDGIDTATFEYWTRLADLCHIIHDGSRALRVPRYNGNLFRTEAGSFLAGHRLGDRYFAAALMALTVDEADNSASEHRVFFDYSSLGVRHLGDIYEGLLEFHIRIASEPMAEVFKDGRRVWEAARGVPEKRIRDRRGPGEVYIETSKHERRLTGSYFTPHEIVAHMVEHTIVPAVDERLSMARGAIDNWSTGMRELEGAPASDRSRLEDRTQALAGKAFDTAFSIRVLDPAMGSGHFLVDAVDVISNHIMEFLGELPDNPISERIARMQETILHDLQDQGVDLAGRDLSKLAEPNLVKRMVMKRCIFGVDVNPMAVELAKLSLWLDSFTIGAPLSFLDHHLRVGNSLVGVSLEEVESGVAEERRPGAAGAQALLFGGRYAGVLRAAQRMLDVAALSDITWDERMASEQLFAEAETVLVPFVRALNLWAAEEFGVRGGRRLLTHGGDDIDVQLANPDRLQQRDRRLLDRAEAAASEHGFLHWELAFPEIYHERGSRKENPGFDVVIGNPPYVRIQEMEDELEGRWLRSTRPDGRSRYVTPHKNFDLYVPFIERGFLLCQQPGGRFCFIVPNKWFQAEYAERLRGFLAEKEAVNRIVSFGDNQIFEESEVTNYTCLLFLAMVPKSTFEYVEVLPLADVRRELPSVLAHPDRSDLALREEFDIGTLGADPWCLPVGIARRIIAKAHRVARPLVELVDDIIVGIQTSADDVYQLVYLGPGRSAQKVLAHSRSLGEEVEMEIDLLKPLVSGKGVERYGAPYPVARLLFPYLITKGGVELIPESTFRHRWPLTWKYLERNEDRLRQREDGAMDHDQWYAYVYPKNLDKQEFPKLCVPRLVDKLKSFHDERGELYLDNVDVNAVLVAGIRPLNSHYVLALLNSTLVDFVFKLCSVHFQNRFYSANKQFISRLPIRRIPFVTPPAVRKELLREGLEISMEVAQKGDAAKLNAWLAPVLSSVHRPDARLVRRYASGPEWSQWVGQGENGWERADVLHDLLAALSLRMTQLYGQMRKERNDFLRWLLGIFGRELLRVRLPEQMSKYENLHSGEFLEILKTHRFLPQSATRSRHLADQIIPEFERSREQVRLLMAEFEGIHHVIDDIVYKLYGMSEDDIRAIETSYAKLT